MIRIIKALSIILVLLSQACNDNVDKEASSVNVESIAVENKAVETMLVDSLAVNNAGKQTQTQTLSVTGTVNLSDEVSVEEVVLIKVQLIDHSLADAPFVLINEVELTNISTLPLTFNIPYDPNVIEEYRSYSISAKAYKMNDKNELVSVLYTTQTYPVLSHGAGVRADIYLSKY